MEPLVIEYVFEGHRRGYNFTSPTRGYDDATLRAVWRHAMPRGQGWGAPEYLGASSLKCFALENGRCALAEVTVTGQQDEGGRRGIRRAVVRVMRPEECADLLRARQAAYPFPVHAWVERKPTLAQWKRIVDEALPKLRRDAQIVLVAPFTDMFAWQAVEAFVLKVALSPLLSLKRAGSMVPFTTLALDYRDESPLVALPARHLAQTDAVEPVRLAL